MAIVASEILREKRGSAGSSFTTTGTISPVGTKLYLIGVGTHRGAGNPSAGTVTGCGMTWTQQDTTGGPGTSFDRLTVYEGTGTPSSGAITVDFSGQSQDEIMVSVVEVTNVPASSRVPQTKVATVAAGTSLTATMNSAPAAGNGMIAWMQVRSTTAVTMVAGSGFTLFDVDNNLASAARFNAEWKDSGDQTVDYSWTGAHDGLIVAAEVAFQAAGGGGGGSNFEYRFRRRRGG